MLEKTKEKLYTLVEENPGITLVIMAILIGLLISDAAMVKKAKEKLGQLI